jgi:hypothetical protein
LNFSAPSNNGGNAVTSYTATCTSSNGGTTRSATGAGSPLSVASLSAGHAYTCTVTATNARGTGPASNARSLAATWVNTSYYDCPSGGSLSGATCYVPDQNWVTSTWGATPTYACSISGSTQIANNITDRHWTSPYYGTSPHDTSFGSGACAGVWTRRNYYSTNSSTCHNFSSTGTGASRVNGCPYGSFAYRRRDTHTRTATAYQTGWDCGGAHYVWHATCSWYPSGGYWANPAYSYAARYVSQGYWNGWSVS